MYSILYIPLIIIKSPLITPNHGVYVNLPEGIKLLIYQNVQLWPN